MTEVKLEPGGPVAYREAPTGDRPGAAALVCVHGFPQSSRMWVPLMRAVSERGRRCLAPDLYGFGNSADFGPASFENSLQRFGDWIDSFELESVALAVHDWGGFIGLAWACDNRERIESLVISDTGFFADGKWHGMAQALRGEQGEEMIGGLDRHGFAGLLNAQGEVFSSEDLDAYWAPFAADAGGRGQRATLEFYRSMDFEKLAPWQGRLAEIAAPSLILWGADDPFAPLAGAHRFEHELADATLVALEDAGHFVFDQQPERCIAEIVAFLDR